MNRRADLSSDAKVLGKISKRFSKFRRAGGGRYPASLKSMAVAAVRGGLSKSSVARAAGIATSLLYFWLAGAPKAKRLRLVEASAAGGVGCDVAPKEALVCVRLASGVEIDIPRSELSVEFLATLSAIGSPR